MENNNLKEQVRKDVKEKIAVSNIRKEFDMKSKNNKKLIYWVSSICAVFVLCFSLLISIDFLNNDSNTEIAKNNGTEDLYGKKENLDIKLNINKIKEPLMASLDADEKIIDIEKLPEKFDFIKNTNIPRYSLNINGVNSKKNNPIASKSPIIIMMPFRRISLKLFCCFTICSKNTSNITNKTLLVSASAAERSF